MAVEKYKSNRVNKNRTITFKNNLMTVMIDLSDEALQIENVKSIIEADLVNLNGLLMMFPDPVFYHYLEKKYDMNEQMIKMVEQKLQDMFRDAGAEEKSALN